MPTGTFKSKTKTPPFPIPPRPSSAPPGNRHWVPVQVPLHASPPSPQYTPRPPSSPGIGVELETSSVRFSITSNYTDPHTKEETFWKGRRLLEFDPGPEEEEEEKEKKEGKEEKPQADVQLPATPIPAGQHVMAKGHLGHWALTLDTTAFHPDTLSKAGQFTAEIVVDGTSLKLDPERNVLAEMGQEILDTVRAGRCETRLPFTFDGEAVVGTASLDDKTVFSIQITCACPLSVAYDILYTPSLLYPLGQKEQAHRDAWWYTDLSTGQPYDLDDMVEHLKGKRKDAQDPEERERLDQLSIAARRGQPLPGYQIRTGHETDDKKIPLAFADLLLGAFGDKHDPKQRMPIMPRTSLKKIFTTLSWTQQAAALAEIQRQKNQRILSPEVGDQNPVLFQDYLRELTWLHARMRPGNPPLTGDEYIPDPLGQHPEALGIGKLLDATETNLDGGEELPVLEFRKIGGCTLVNLPQTLGSIYDELMARLQAALPQPPGQ